MSLIGKKTFSIACKLSEDDDSDVVMEIPVLLLYSLTTNGQKPSSLHYSFV